MRDLVSGYCSEDRGDLSIGVSIRSKACSSIRSFLKIYCKIWRFATLLTYKADVRIIRNKTSRKKVATLPVFPHHFMPKAAQKRILVTGTVAFDHLFSYDAAFLEKLKTAIEKDVLSVSFQTHEYKKKFGGTGANIAWNLRLLGSDPMLVANIGKDGGEYIEFLKKADIDTTYLQVLQNEMTPTGVCCTDTKQHQIWLWYYGADSVPLWPDLSKEMENIAYAIVGPRHFERMLDALDWCKQQKLPVLFDPGQHILELTPEQMKNSIEGCTGIIGNEFEWLQIQNKINATPEEIGKQVDFAIVTESENGFSTYTKEGKKSYPRCDADKFAEPTGAGDAFRGGLVTGLVHGWDLENSGKLGAALASFAVEEHGTLMTHVNREQVFARAEKTYGHKLPALA
jgi:adenosine kinase